jgi:hypothetical protein
MTWRHGCKMVQACGYLATRVVQVGTSMFTAGLMHRKPCDAVRLPGWGWAPIPIVRALSDPTGASRRMSDGTEDNAKDRNPDHVGCYSTKRSLRGQSCPGE